MRKGNKYTQRRLQNKNDTKIHSLARRELKADFHVVWIFN